jgi:hypothetical protein
LCPCGLREADEVFTLQRLADAFAVVAAESTISMSGPMAARMAPASMGKWVHPNTSVSGEKTGLLGVTMPKPSHSG